ncbi:uncharacterized protein SPAPADRAFT_65510 [Spathaspora passalidarum NRRL Y-27907]|uniref:Uncharacterized protein n=1 Tax=Spathaspora passalidarum (strain NRRL Y-27907 / 11-Y1) TaxID=619300 RepID=G3AI57_SPAPN|nr:uncharacterized protein SPAPADRAFT_65510 [Spathaspora passalidarum NRRL Y-27907]EGW34371.1 hypothetical protein SPAPADRAFT_65510 [Spathaspora passalidarum NRRL Y-27907]
MESTLTTNEPLINHTMFQSSSTYGHKRPDISSYLHYSPANSDSTIGHETSPSELVNQLDMAGFLDIPNETEASSTGALNGHESSFSLQSTPRSKDHESQVLLPSNIQTPAKVPNNTQTPAKVPSNIQTPAKVNPSNQKSEFGKERETRAEIERIARDVFSEWKAKAREEIRAEVRKEVMSELQTESPKTSALKESVVPEQPRIVSYNTELSLKGESNTATTSPMNSPKQNPVDLKEKLNFEKSKIDTENLHIPAHVLQMNDPNQNRINKLENNPQQIEDYRTTISDLSNEVSKCKDVISEFKRENDSLKLLIRGLYSKIENLENAKEAERNMDHVKLSGNTNKADPMYSGTSRFDSESKEMHDRITQTEKRMYSEATQTPRIIPPEHGKPVTDFNSYPSEVRSRLAHINAHKLDSLSEDELRYILRNLMYVLMIDYDVLEPKSIKYAKFISMASRFIDGVHDRLYPNGGILRTGLLLKCQSNKMSDDKSMEKLNNCLHDMLDNLAN